MTVNFMCNIVAHNTASITIRVDTHYIPDKYKGNVSFNASVISIPLDVYDNWTDVRLVRSMYWSICPTLSTKDPPRFSVLSVILHIILVFSVVKTNFKSGTRYNGATN